MDFTEPEHIALLRGSLTRFTERHMPREQARLWDKNDHFPEDVFKALGDAGMMSLVVPEEYGGAGRDILACMVVIEELSKRSMSAANAVLIKKKQNSYGLYFRTSLVVYLPTPSSKRLTHAVSPGHAVKCGGLRRYTETGVGGPAFSTTTSIFGV